MAKTIRKPRKSASKRRKVVVIHQRVGVRSKSKESGKNDTIGNAPTKVPDVGATFKVKIRKK